MGFEEWGLRNGETGSGSCIEMEVMECSVGEVERVERDVWEARQAVASTWSSG